MGRNRSVCKYCQKKHGSSQIEKRDCMRRRRKHQSDEAIPDSEKKFNDQANESSLNEMSLHSSSGKNGSNQSKQTFQTRDDVSITNFEIPDITQFKQLEAVPEKQNDQSDSQDEKFQNQLLEAIKRGPLEIFENIHPHLPYFTSDDMDQNVQIVYGLRRPKNQYRIDMKTKLDLQIKARWDAYNKKCMRKKRCPKIKVVHTTQLQWVDDWKYYPMTNIKIMFARAKKIKFQQQLVKKIKTMMIGFLWHDDWKFQICEKPTRFWTIVSEVYHRNIIVNGWFQWRKTKTISYPQIETYLQKVQDHIKIQIQNFDLYHDSKTLPSCFSEQKCNLHTFVIQHILARNQNYNKERALVFINQREKIRQDQESNHMILRNKYMIKRQSYRKSRKQTYRQLKRTMQNKIIKSRKVKRSPGRLRFEKYQAPINKAWSQSYRSGKTPRFHLKKNNKLDTGFYEGLTKHKNRKISEVGYALFKNPHARLCLDEKLRCQLEKARLSPNQDVKQQISIKTQETQKEERKQCLFEYLEFYKCLKVITLQQIESTLCLVNKVSELHRVPLIKQKIQNFHISENTKNQLYRQLCDMQYPDHSPQHKLIWKICRENTSLQQIAENPQYGQFVKQWLTDQRIERIAVIRCENQQRLEQIKKIEAIEKKHAIRRMKPSQVVWLVKNVKYFKYQQQQLFVKLFEILTQPPRGKYMEFYGEPSQNMIDQVRKLMKFQSTKSYDKDKTLFYQTKTHREVLKFAKKVDITEYFQTLTTQRQCNFDELEKIFNKMMETQRNSNQHDKQQEQRDVMQEQPLIKQPLIRHPIFDFGEVQEFGTSVISKSSIQIPQFVKDIPPLTHSAFKMAPLRVKQNDLQFYKKQIQLFMKSKDLTMDNFVMRKNFFPPQFKYTPEMEFFDGISKLRPSDLTYLDQMQNFERIVPIQYVFINDQIGSGFNASRDIKKNQFMGFFNGVIMEISVGNEIKNNHNMMDYTTFDDKVYVITTAVNTWSLGPMYNGTNDRRKANLNMVRVWTDRGFEYVIIANRFIDKGEHLIWLYSEQQNYETQSNKLIDIQALLDQRNRQNQHKKVLYNQTQMIDESHQIHTPKSLDSQLQALRKKEEQQRKQRVRRQVQAILKKERQERNERLRLQEEQRKLEKEMAALWSNKPINELKTMQKNLDMYPQSCSCSQFPVKRVSDKVRIQSHAVSRFALRYNSHIPPKRIILRSQLTKQEQDYLDRAKMGSYLKY